MDILYVMRIVIHYAYIFDLNLVQKYDVGYFSFPQLESEDVPFDSDMKYRRECGSAGGVVTGHAPRL